MEFKAQGRSLHPWPFCKQKSDFDTASLSKQYFKQLARMLQKFSVLLFSGEHCPFFPLAFNKNLGTRSKGEESAQCYKWLPRTNAKAGKG